MIDNDIIIFSSANRRSSYSGQNPHRPFGRNSMATSDHFRVVLEAVTFQAVYLQRLNLAFVLV